MKRLSSALNLLIISLTLAGQNDTFRPPSFPIITHDPYLSIWMPDENPTDEETVHWTLKPMPLRSMVRIDGNVYPLMGKTPAFVPAAKSAGSVVMPMQTEFSFFQDGIGNVLNFLSPVLSVMYCTKTAEWRGFTARSVVGDVYIELFQDKMMKKRTGVYKPDVLPTRGLCAHRGAMETYPENTIPAFQEAIRSGAHMIEFDVYLTRDKKMVIIHDPTVDRTTNGSGKVSDFTLEQIKKLDAGSWKSPKFTGVRIPEIHEVLKIMPVNIWLNIHIKDEDTLAVLVAKTIANEKRLRQAFMACGAASAKKAREAVPGILICNMDRQDSGWKYVWSTIGMKADFIQLTGPVEPVFSEYAEILKKNGVRINYYGTDSPGEIKKLFEYGVEFPLVNNIPKTIGIAADLGIDPVKPVFPE